MPLPYFWVLLRLFRRYLKKHALPKGTYRKIRNQALKHQGELLVQALKLPDELSQQKMAQMAVLLLINSHSLTHRKQLTAECCSIMGQNAELVW